MKTSRDRGPGKQGGSKDRDRGQAAGRLRPTWPVSDVFRNSSSERCATSEPARPWAVTGQLTLHFLLPPRTARLSLAPLSGLPSWRSKWPLKDTAEGNFLLTDFLALGWAKSRQS